MRTLLASLAAVGMLALLILIGVVYTSTQSNAVNGGGHGACDGGIVSIAPINDYLATYDAGNDTITGLCLKAGNTETHTFFVKNAHTDCYSISGIGTSVVTVTRLGEGKECPAISHIDVLVASPTPTPTPPPEETPTPTTTPCPVENRDGEEGCLFSTPTPTPSPTPTPTPIADPTPTTTPLVPVTFPDTGGEPARK